MRTSAYFALAYEIPKANFMEEKRYAQPGEDNGNLASEPLIATSRLSALQDQLVRRVKDIQDTDTLQSLIVYIDTNILPEKETFEEGWKRAISIEEFRSRCKDKLKAKYGKP